MSGGASHGSWARRLAGIVRGVAGGVVGLVRAAPVTVVFVVALWSVGVATGAIVHGPDPRWAGAVGVGVGPAVRGQWWVPVTSLLWCSGLVFYLVNTALVVAVLPGGERVLGRVRSLALLVGVQALGAGMGVALAAAIALSGGRWGAQVGSAVAVGPSGALFGFALAASARMPVVWRRRLRVVGLVGLSMFALYSALLPDIVRLTAGVAGLCVGAWIWRDRRAVSGISTGSSTAFSKPEGRLLVALIVVASAVGPLIAAWAHTRIGPLSLLRYVFASPPPDAARVQQVCADPSLGSACSHLRARLRINGVGPAVMSMMPVLLLLAAAQGIRLGRRAAWLAAIGLNLALTALGVWLAVSTLAHPRSQWLMIGPDHRVPSWVLLVAPLVQPLLVAGLLVAMRGWFRIRAPSGTYSRWVGRVGATLLVVSVVYVAGSVVFASGYLPEPGLGDVLADLPMRLLPPGYLGAIDSAFWPARAVNTVLYEWTGVLFWAVVVIGALRTFARTRPPVRGSGGLLRRLLAVGGGSLAYPVTWSGNSYWFTADRAAAVAYRVIGGVALTAGNPVGDEAAHDRAVREFALYCQDNQWIPCFYAVDARIVASAATLGWRAAHIASEAVVELGEVRFTGKRWQNVRTAFNRAERDNIAAVWYRHAQAPAAVTDQISSISRQWLADKGLPEMGFTLGRVGELADDEVKLLAAVGPDGVVHAVTSWLPIRRHGELIGYTLDFMRRRPDAFNGVMDFLIASAMRDCQAEGLRLLSLSGAPLARPDTATDTSTLIATTASTPTQRVLDTLARILEPVYGFQALLAFKSRFRPVYRPRYLTYPDTFALPRIGRAIVRAYLPHVPPTQLAQLLPRLLTGHTRGPRPPPASRVASRPGAELRPTAQGVRDDLTARC